MCALFWGQPLHLLKFPAKIAASVSCLDTQPDSWDLDLRLARPRPGLKAIRSRCSVILTHTLLHFKTHYDRAEFHLILSPHRGWKELIKVKCTLISFSQWPECASMRNLPASPRPQEPVRGHRPLPALRTPSAFPLQPGGDLEREMHFVIRYSFLSQPLMTAAPGQIQNPKMRPSTSPNYCCY